MNKCAERDPNFKIRCFSSDEKDNEKDYTILQSVEFK